VKAFLSKRAARAAERIDARWRGYVRDNGSACYFALLEAF
jgi:hypothetical protein